LLAYALGGQVGDNPNGLEFGTIDVHLTKSAQSDRLLAGLRSPLKAQLCHAQSVLQLPDGARRLASSSKDANQAFVIGPCAWGVQFHPEFDAEVVAEYIKHNRLPLQAEGQDTERLLETCAPTPRSASILSRFAQLADSR
jgi:GMP synthase (glutamine-hydrolysing)